MTMFASREVDQIIDLLCLRIKNIWVRKFAANSRPNTDVTAYNGAGVSGIHGLHSRRFFVVN